MFNLLWLVDWLNRGVTQVKMVEIITQLRIEPAYHLCNSEAKYVLLRIESNQLLHVWVGSVVFLIK